MERKRGTYPSAAASRRGFREPAGYPQVFRHRLSALSRPGIGGRGHGPLPCRTGQFLWNRPFHILPEQYFPNLAPAAGCLLDCHGLYCGRTVSRCGHGGQGTRRTGKRGPPALCSRRDRRSRQSARRDARCLSASRKPLVLVRSPGMGIPRSRKGLAGSSCHRIGLLAYLGHQRDLSCHEGSGRKGDVVPLSARCPGHSPVLSSCHVLQ